LIVYPAFGTLTKLVALLIHRIHPFESMSTTKRLVLGADGGGTKTLGILAAEDGTELSRLQVGPGNPNVTGVERAAGNLLDLVAGCCERAGCTLPDLQSIVFGLAGVGSLTVRSKLAEALRAESVARSLPELPITLETDARIALEGAFGGGPGVVMIAGTGSILIGKLPGGEVRSVGGWGRVLGDEGSGYFIGLEATKAVSRDIDGREDAAVLRKVLAEANGWDSRDRVIAAVYQERFDLASLAPLVLRAAGEKDPAALRILRRAASHLADQLKAMVRAMGSQSKVGVVFIGGLIDHDTVYERLLRETITELVPSADVCPALHPPVGGAVLMALSQLQRS
jgi:N-acetylglucosamine kinase-like BadF-type ATPase